MIRATDSILLGRLLSASTRRPVLEEFGWSVPTTGGTDFGVDLEAGASSLAFSPGDRFAASFHYSLTG